MHTTSRIGSLSYCSIPLPQQWEILTSHTGSISHSHCTCHDDDNSHFYHSCSTTTTIHCRILNQITIQTRTGINGNLPATHHILLSHTCPCLYGNLYTQWALPTSSRTEVILPKDQPLYPSVIMPIATSTMTSLQVKQQITSTTAYPEDTQPSGVTLLCIQRANTI